MPTFRVTGPDGATYKVNVPDGASENDAIDYVAETYYAGDEGEAESMVGGLVRSALQGATFNFGDELRAGASAALGAITGQGSFSDLYDVTRDYERRNQQEFSDAHPVASGAAELAGGLLTGFAGGAKAASTQAGQRMSSALKALPFKERVKRSALLGSAGGAAGGAVTGAGAAREISDIPGEALIGAGIGGALGGAISPAVEIGGTAIRAGKKILGDAMNPEYQAARNMARIARRSEMTPDQMLASAGASPNALLADTSEAATSALESYANQPGAARKLARETLDARAKTAQQRIVHSLMDNIGADDLNFDGAVQGLHTNMRRVAAEHGYDEILNSGQVEMTESLEKLMGSSTMRKALGAANSILDDDIALGRADKKLQQYFKDTGDDGAMFMPFGGKYGEMAARPTLRVWDYVKRGIDAVINDGTDPITGKMSSQAERASALKRQLLKEIDEANPDYHAVRSAYADEKSAETALKMGRNFLSSKYDPETITRHLGDMSESERQFFRVGAARAIYDKVMSVIDTGSGWRRFVRSPGMRDKISRIFPDPDDASRFMRTLEAEANQAEMRHTVLGNSATARRLASAAEDNERGEMVAGAAGDVVDDMLRGQNPLTGALRRGAQAIAGVRPSNTEAAREATARQLLEINPAMRAEMFRRNQGLLTAPIPDARYPLLAPGIGAQIGTAGGLLALP